ncbi:hypothetical protein IL306_001954, partial [Fusarium sp. DS 682]
QPASQRAPPSSFNPNTITIITTQRIASSVKSNRRITPPERQPQSLPSPPASDERKQVSTATGDELPQTLVEFKLKCKTGNCSPLANFYLSKADYTRLHDKIQAAFRRFDYNPLRQLISFRMPSALHDLLISFFGSAIINAIREIGRQNRQTRAFSDSIDNALSSRVLLVDGDDKWEQQQDAQFEQNEARHPGVVLEVALT